MARGEGGGQRGCEGAAATGGGSERDGLEGDGGDGGKGSGGVACKRAHPLGVGSACNSVEGKACGGWQALRCGPQLGPNHG